MSRASPCAPTLSLAARPEPAVPPNALPGDGAVGKTCLLTRYTGTPLWPSCARLVCRSLPRRGDAGSASASARCAMLCAGGGFTDDYVPTVLCVCARAVLHQPRKRAPALRRCLSQCL